MTTRVSNILWSGSGKTISLIVAATVLVALIGTTLACLNTGVRVTFAMARDGEMPSILEPAARQARHAALGHLDPDRRLGGDRHLRRAHRRQPDPDHHRLERGHLPGVRRHLPHRGGGLRQPPRQARRQALRDPDRRGPDEPGHAVRRALPRAWSARPRSSRTTSRPWAPTCSGSSSASSGSWLNPKMRGSKLIDTNAPKRDVADAAPAKVGA